MIPFKVSPTDSALPQGEANESVCLFCPFNRNGPPLQVLVTIQFPELLRLAT